MGIFKRSMMAVAAIGAAGAIATGGSIPALARPAPVCTGALSLHASTAAAPPGDATSLYYAHNGQSANTSTGPGVCSAYLSSSGTMAKTSASQANMTLHSIEMSCTGWLESSADNGKTWEQVTPTYSAGLNQEWAFSSAVADGTGQLTRACVQGTGAKVCTAAW